MGKTSKFSPKIAKVTTASALMLVGMGFSPVTAGLLGAAPGFDEEVAAETVAGQDSEQAAPAAGTFDAEGAPEDEAATDDAADSEEAPACGGCGSR